MPPDASNAELMKYAETVKASTLYHSRHHDYSTMMHEQSKEVK